MPNDVLIPVLSYPSVSEAVAWLTAAFGFGRRWQVDEHRAQLSVGRDAAIAITHGAAAPPGTDHIMIRVEHVDAHRRQAQGAGAKVTEATDQMYGERQYTAVDFSGRAWVFTESIKNIDPEDWGATVFVS